jgi:hypothetical protein
MDIDHSYESDFLVRLTNGATVMLEIKGFEAHAQFIGRHLKRL